MPAPDPESVIQNWASLARQLNPHGRPHSGNCPAVAAAVDDYLSTGNIRPAAVLGPFEVLGDLRSANSVVTAAHSLTRHGDHCVVLAYEIRPPPRGGPTGHHHEFNLLRVRAQTYMLDAFTQPPVLATDLVARTRWARFFEYGRGLRVRSHDTRGR
jgi:hypothetical protein